MKEKGIDKETQRNSVKVMATLIILVLITVVAIYYMRGLNKAPDPGLDVMKCIAENSSLFVSKGCSHCAQQEKDLGKYLSLFNITDCLDNAKLCTSHTIASVPTWIIRNNTYSGIKSFDELRKYTGC